ncbi:MAG: hypothetical protein ACK47E_16370, partial [Cyclobacteriaceae bacterium]
MSVRREIAEYDGLYFITSFILRRVSVFGTLRKHKLCGKTLVVVGQDILLLLVSRPTILLLLKDRT